MLESKGFVQTGTDEAGCFEMLNEQTKTQVTCEFFSLQGVHVMAVTQMNRNYMPNSVADVTRALAETADDLTALLIVGIGSLNGRETVGAEEEEKVKGVDFLRCHISIDDPADVTDIHLHLSILEHCHHLRAALLYLRHEELLLIVLADDGLEVGRGAILLRKEDLALAYCDKLLQK